MGCGGGGTEQLFWVQIVYFDFLIGEFLQIFICRIMGNVVNHYEFQC